MCSYQSESAYPCQSRRRGRGVSSRSALHLDSHTIHRRDGDLVWMRQAILPAHASAHRDGGLSKRGGGTVSGGGQHPPEGNPPDNTQQRQKSCKPLQTATSDARGTRPGPGRGRRSTWPGAGEKEYRLSKRPMTMRASSSEKCWPRQLRGPLIKGK